MADTRSTTGFLAELLAEIEEENRKKAEAQQRDARDRVRRGFSEDDQE